MFRVKDSDQGRVMHCMFRIPSFRFRRSLSIHNLRQFMNRAPSQGWSKFDLTMRLAKRAIYFHSLIKANQGKPKGLLDGLEIVPLDSGSTWRGTGPTSLSPQGKGERKAKTQMMPSR